MPRLRPNKSLKLSDDDLMAMLEDDDRVDEEDMIDDFMELTVVLEDFFTVVDDETVFVDDVAIDLVEEIDLEELKVLELDDVVCTDVLPACWPPPDGLITKVLTCFSDI